MAEEKLVPIDAKVRASATVTYPPAPPDFSLAPEGMDEAVEELNQAWTEYHEASAAEDDYFRRTEMRRTLPRLQEAQRALGLEPTE